MLLMLYLGKIISGSAVELQQRLHACSLLLELYLAHSKSLKEAELSNRGIRVVKELIVVVSNFNFSSTRQWGGGVVCSNDAANRESLTWASLSAIVYRKVVNATDEVRRARQRAQMY